MGPGGELLGQQSATGFMEVATSTLIFETSNLAGGVNEFTCISNDTAQSSVNVTGYCESYASLSACLGLFALISPFDLV